MSTELVDPAELWLLQQLGTPGWITRPGHSASTNGRHRGPSPGRNLFDPTKEFYLAIRPSWRASKRSPPLGLGRSPAAGWVEKKERKEPLVSPYHYNGTFTTGQPTLSLDSLSVEGRRTPSGNCLFWAFLMELRPSCQSLLDQKYKSLGMPLSPSESIAFNSQG